jgi:hypothetical protein
MKLIFFLIAFSLVAVRTYFSWSGKEQEKKGISESNISIRSDNFNEEISYSGKFQLSDDETSFKSMSPGGFFRFKRNEVAVRAESNLQGNIEYRITDGDDQIPMNERGKKLLAEAIREMINWGFDAEERMKRIFLKGGPTALLNEVDSMKSDAVRRLYLGRLLEIDSISPSQQVSLISKLGLLESDADKVAILKKIVAAQLKKQVIDSVYFEVIGKIGSDADRTNILQYILTRDSISPSNTEKLMDLTSRLSSDADKRELFDSMIKKDLIEDSLYDTLLKYSRNFNSETDRIELYHKLILDGQMQEIQWVSFMESISQLSSDHDKTDLLILIGQKMPQTENLKETYRKTARTISNDTDYGRAMRAIH